MKRIIALFLSLGITSSAFAANEILLVTTTVPTTSVAYLIYTMLEKGGTPELEVTKFVQDNELDLVQNIAIGSGRSLEALANLVGIHSIEQQLHFYREVQNNFEVLFPTNQTIQHKDIAKGLLHIASRV